MSSDARYVHTNIVARDWRRLADFYQKVFGCEPVPPERHLSGHWLEEATGVPGAEIRGAHLRLPGHGEGGPTLEIFQYHPCRSGEDQAVNRTGIAHLAFAVADVDATLERVKDEGGGEVGKPVSVEIPGAGIIRFVYVADPEGNIIELQTWMNGP